MRSPGYLVLTSRRELLWFPAALAGLFVVLLAMMRHPDVRYAIARGYLGFFVPLLAGITAAYSVLDDPMLELRFSTPVRHAETLLARLGLQLAAQGACALAFQLAAAGFGVDFSPLGGVVALQLAWLVPTVALAALGTFGALAAGQCAAGAFLAGATWLVQLLMKSWLLANGRRFYLFLGILEPGHPELAASRAALAAASAAMLAASWALVRRQERYL